MPWADMTPGRSARSSRRPMAKQILDSPDASVQSSSGVSNGSVLKGTLLRGKPRNLFRCSASPAWRVSTPSARWNAARGEVSIYDSVPLISEVRDSQTDVSIDFNRRAAFLVYAIVENWRRVTLRKSIGSERQFEEQLLPFAVESGIDVDQPFPYLVHCHISPGHVPCPRQSERGRIQSRGARKGQSSFSDR